MFHFTDNKVKFREVKQLVWVHTAITQFGSGSCGFHHTLLKHTDRLHILPGLLGLSLALEASIEVKSSLSFVLPTIELKSPRILGTFFHPGF